MLAFDAQSFKDITATDSFTHTPVLNPRAVIVMIAQTTAETDRISAVTYGGVTMTRVPTNGYAVDTLNEPGAAYIYFLGGGIPTGVQTVAVTVSAGTEAKVVWCVTASGKGVTEVAASAMLQENQTNPSMTLSTEIDFQGLVCCVFYSGLIAPSDANIAPAAGYTKLTGTDTGGKDFGNQCAVGVYGVKTGINVVCSFTSAGEDVAISCVAIRERKRPTTFNNYQHISSDGGMWVTEKNR
jgi:hypothetical protein